MTEMTIPSAPALARAPRRGPLSALATPADAFAHIGPNWFASVMGTGIVPVAASLLTVRVAVLQPLAVTAWVIAATLLVALGAATIVHWVRHPGNARGHARDLAMAPFYGAPPMAMLTVGAGALLAGRHLIGLHAAVIVDSVLWTAGTLTGLAASVVVPYLMFTAHRPALADTLGSWLMPIVPPMVSAATGPALIAHLPAGQPRLDMLLACYAMFGLSLVASLMIIALLWARLTQHGPGPAQTVPTLLIVLGPLGQSITAANLLGAQAQHVLPAPYGAALRAARRRLRRSGARLRAAVAGDRGHHHGEHRPSRTPVQPDVVELHLPRRHDRHWQRRARAAHRLARRRGPQRRPVPPAPDRRGHRADQHRTGSSQRPSAAHPCGRRRSGSDPERASRRRVRRS
jgi:tellurite resistance protein TehA-like permease